MARLDGGPVTLIRSYGPSSRLARGPLGHVLLRSFNRSGNEVRQGYRPGSCNHMPSPVPDEELWPLQIAVYVLRGEVDISVVDAPYESIRVELVCDENLY